MHPEAEVVINIQTTCTRDEALAKLMGWARGRYFPRYVNVTEWGVDEVDLKKVAEFQWPVEDQLREMFAKTQHELTEARAAGESSEILEMLTANINRIKVLIDKAADYLQDLDDELSDPDHLRVDARRSEEVGRLHITIKSLAAWAMRKYQIDIMQPVDQEVLTDVDFERPKVNLDDGAYSGRGGLTNTDKVNIAFAALVGVCAKSIPKFRKGDGGANASTLAVEMEKYLYELRPSSPVRGFKKRTLEARIVDAQAAERKYLRQ